MDSADLINRCRSLLVSSPYDCALAPDPTTWRGVPKELFAAGPVARVTSETAGIVGLLGPYEEREDTLTVYVASAYSGDVDDTRRALHTLASSLTASLVQDGTGVGEFVVGDGGRTVDVAAPEGAGYAVMRLTVPVTYVAAL